MVSLLQNFLPIPVESVTFIKDSDKVLYSELPSMYIADSEGSELENGFQSIQNIKKNIAMYRKENITTKASKKQKGSESNKQPSSVNTKLMAEWGLDDETEVV